MREAILLATLMAILAACGAGTDPDAVGDATTVATTTPTTGSDTTTMPRSEQLPIVAPAIEDLARRLRAPSDAIEVVSTEEVTWPDGSLGCPEPGMSYTQALEDGSKVVLRHEDRVFVYHAGDDDQPFLCASEDKDGGHEFIPPPGFNE